jgi:hypothetical protein
VPAKLKLTDADLKKIRRHLRAGARCDELAAAYGVNRKTIQRRLKALELAEAEPGLKSELEAKPATTKPTGTSAAAGRSSLPEAHDRARSLAWPAGTRAALGSAGSARHVRALTGRERRASPRFAGSACSGRERERPHGREHQREQRPADGCGLRRQLRPASGRPGLARPRTRSRFSSWTCLSHSGGSATPFWLGRSPCFGGILH